MSMTDVLEVKPVSTETIEIPEPEDNNILKYNPYVLVDNGSKLMYIDPEIISKSKYCNKNSVVMKIENVIAMESRKKTKRIQHIPENTDVLVVMLEGANILKKSCVSLSDFYEFLIYLDKYCFSVDVTLVSPLYTMWLSKIKNLSEMEWDVKENADILLTTAEYRHEKHAFPTDVNVPPVQNNGYPNGVAQQPLQKPDRIQLPQNIFSIDEVKYFEAVLTMLCEREMYDPVCTKLIDEIIWVYATSVRDCHMLVSTKKIMSIVMQRKNIDVVLHYLLKILYVDEINIKSDLRYGHRIILNDEITSVIGGNIQHTPLDRHPFTLMNGNRIKHRTGMVLPGLLVGERGIYESKQIQERINIYTCGYLKNFTWEKTALCGSCIPATTIINPLEKYHDSYESYLQHYYPMLQQTKEINISKLKYSFAPQKHTEQVVTEQEHLFDISDIDIMIETTDDNEFDQICQKHFEEIQQAIKQEHLQVIKNITLEKKQTENKYKYVVHGLRRPLEMFSVNSIPGVINKFHLSCVRAWFDGTHFNSLPSFVSTAATGINMDIRWTSCNKDIRATILKYFRRGFGIYLNKNDLENMKAFITAHIDEYSEFVIEAPAVGRRRRYQETVWFSKLGIKIFGLRISPNIDVTQLHQSKNRYSRRQTNGKYVSWIIKGFHITPKKSEMMREMSEYVKFK